jgi:hypothetical protein
MSDVQAPLQSILMIRLVHFMRLLFFLVTPEKLCSPEFMKLLGPLYQRGELNRLVVDEVCLIYGTFFRQTNSNRHIVYPCVSDLFIVQYSERYR